MTSAISLSRTVRNRLATTFCLVLFYAFSAFGQSAVIEGTVVDAEIGEGLPGANIIVQGTAQGTATNLDGSYRLELEPGS